MFVVLPPQTSTSEALNSVEVTAVSANCMSMSGTERTAFQASETFSASSAVMTPASTRSSAADCQHETTSS